MPKYKLQLQHHPVIGTLTALIIGPFLLAAALLYGVVFVLVVIFTILFGRKP